MPKAKSFIVAMPMSFLFLLVASLQVTARGIAQLITLSEKNAKLEVLFDKIRQQTNYTFLLI